jgi:hypothetical protein
MPCYLVQRLHVDLSKVDAKYVLASLKGLENQISIAVDGEYAIVSLRAGETVVYRDKKLDITARSAERTAQIENEVKRGISKNVLDTASKRFRWQLTPVEGSPREYDVVKRGF